MLVLDRIAGQKIVINHGLPSEVLITVVDLGRGRVKLGIDAAREITICREECLPWRGPKRGDATGRPDADTIGQLRT